MTILSFGEIIWDVYSRDEHTLGGAPLNFAAYAALLGSNVYLSSSVGDDELGTKALKQIKELGINTEYITTTEKSATGQCLISLDKNGIPLYSILKDVAYDRIPLTDKLEKVFDTVAFGTLALREEHNRRQLKSLLTSNSFSEIYADLNIRPPFYSKESIDFCLSNATIVKISDEELPTVTQTLFDAVLDVQHSVDFITERYPQIKLLLITCGKNGAFCYDMLHGATHFCPAESVTAVSTVGAGDSFGASFLTLYNKTKDIPHSLKLSAKISGFVVSHKEAIPPGVKDFIKNLLYKQEQ